MKALRLAAMVLGFVVPGLAFAPNLAFAHGPTREGTTQSVEINAPAAKVWAVIGNFQNMDWAEGVVKTTGEDGNEPNNATRVYTLKNGATVTQDLTKYDAKEMSYSYFTDKVDVKTLPVHDYSGTIKVVPEGASKSKVVWEAAFYRGYMLNDPPPNLNDAASLKAVNVFLRARLDALKKKVEAMH